MKPRRQEDPNPALASTAEHESPAGGDDDAVNSLVPLVFPQRQKEPGLGSSKMSDVNGIRVPSIEVNNLNYSYPDGSGGLRDVEISLPSGSRTLLIGGK